MKRSSSFIICFAHGGPDDHTFRIRELNSRENGSLDASGSSAFLMVSPRWASVSARLLR